MLTWWWWMCRSRSTASAVSTCSLGRTCSWVTSGATSVQTCLSMWSSIDANLTHLRRVGLAGSLEEILDTLSDSGHVCYWLWTGLGSRVECESEESSVGEENVV